MNIIANNIQSTYSSAQWKLGECIYTFLQNVIQPENESLRCN